MTDPATLNALAAECEAGNWPDRELDARIALAVGANFAIGPWIGVGTYEAVAGSYTASVDAAFSLLQEALPGWRITTGVMDHGFGLTHAAVGESYEAPEDWSHGRAPTLPRAIVAAVLRAVAGER